MVIWDEISLRICVIGQKSKIMTVRSAILIFFLLTSIRIYSQSIREATKDSLTEILYQHANDNSPGMAVGIVKNGNIIYEHYLGYANLEHEIRIDQETRFNIASNAKQFTALCILKLVEEGEMSLEDDIRHFFPDLYKNIEDRITIAHLLNHNSGIRDVYDLWSLKGKTWWKLFVDNGDVIELLSNQKDLNFKPGTEYLYSNSNYILLAEIVGKVTNQDFSEYARTVFEELNMRSTNFLTNYMSVVPYKARPYGNWNGWREYPSITEVHGDGGLFTSLRDQLKWEQIIQLNNEKYISKELINKSQSPIEKSNEGGYGYGVMFDNYRGLDYTYHDGSTGAYQATFLRFVDKDLTVLVLSNNGNVPSNYLAKQLSNIILGLENMSTAFQGAPDKTEKLGSIQDVIGNYENDDGTIVRIKEKGGLVYREIYQSDPVQLINEEGGLFHYESFSDLKMNFTNIGGINQQFTIYLPSQAPASFYRLPDSELKGYNRKELNGRFYNEETDTEVEIEFVENNTYSVTKNGRGRKAELWVKDLLRMNSYKIKILRDQLNNIMGLSIDNDRIRNVTFTRI